MKKLAEFFKNARAIIKALQFAGEVLTSVATIYGKYYGQEEEKPKEKED